MNQRVDRLREQLDEPLLVSDPTNVRYLSGLASSNAGLLVEQDRVRLFTDFRYAEGAQAVEGAEFVETKRDLFLSLAEELSGRIGFEASSLTFERYARLHEGGLDLVPRYGLVEGLRIVKEDSELALIRRAAAITDEAFSRLAAEPFVGRTERQVAWQLERLQREIGGDALSFPVAVASGPNGARPHATPGNRVIQAGETVVVDAGCVVEGYCSDCTRTFATGPLPAQLRKAYDVCRDAQLAGVAAVRAGTSGIEADKAARDVIEGAGLGDAFGHGLGHGVGLLVHEDPRLARESRHTLGAGNVVTVEPGIYLTGAGGVRIEDLVVVRDGEPEVLTPFTKELVTVD